MVSAKRLAVGDIADKSTTAYVSADEQHQARIAYTTPTLIHSKAFSVSLAP